MKTLLTHITVVAAFLALPNALFAEDFSRIDSLSIQTPSEIMGRIEDLTAYCEKHASNDLARVRFYFVWVATHINYDETIGSDQQNPEIVFSSRKAVCSGYTRLLAQLCEKSGIPARYVAGYGKELDDDSSIQNHAWNVIRIEGKWHLFDVTWAANGLEGDLDKPLPEAFEEWFMPLPGVFQKTHLPFDPVYQLAEKLIVRRDFFGQRTEKSNFTEGGELNANLTESNDSLMTSNSNFTDILNEEIVIDSIERIFRSFRRAYDYMPMDSAVAIKLAKAQEGKVKRVFEFVHQFSKNDYPNRREATTEVLKNWVSKLQEAEKPMTDALNIHLEIESLPLSEANKRTQKQNFLFFEKLQNFVKNAIQELNTEIAARE